MELNFTVTNQKIKYVSNLYIVEKSRNYLTAKFSFSGNEWKNVVKTAIFKKDDTVINVLLDENGRCNVPWELITRGTLKVSVFGGDLVTVDTAEVKILKSGYEEGNAPSEPTPDVYAQILTELQDIRSEYVTEEMLGQAVEDWLAENVVEALSPEDVQKIVYGWLEEHKTELKGEKGDSGENGIDGKDGVDGKNGITFTPIIVDGVLSWENNGQLDNPTSFDFNKELGIDTIKSDVETLKDKKDITTTTSTTLPNSHSGRVLIEHIGGNMEQGENTSPESAQEIKGVKGKNHFKNTAISTTKDGIDFTVYDDGSVYAKGISTNAGTTVFVLGEVKIPKGAYIGSGCPSGGASSTYCIRLGLESGGASFLGVDAGSGYSFELQEEKIVELRIHVVGGTSIDGLFEPMIRPASVLDDTYVPYGLLRIKTYKAKGLVNPKTCVNGILNTSGVMTTVTTWTTSDYMEVTSGAKIAVSSNMKVVRFAEYDANKNFIKNTNNIIGVADETYAPWTTILESNTKYVRATFGLETVITPHELFKNHWIQIEEGEPTKFELYEENSIILSQPMELYGKNGIKDLLTPREIERKYNTVTLNGNEGWRLNNAGTQYYIVLKDATVKMGGMVFSTHFSCGEWISAKDANIISLGNDDAGVLGITAASFDSVDDLVSFLQSNEVKVVYELAESTTTKLPPADQIALNSLQSFDGITYVEFDTEVQPTWKAKYGTSEVGGYTLESLLTARNNELKQELANERISALEASVVNNI